MLAVLLLLSCALPQETSTPEVLGVGHVIEVRGSLEAPGRFVAERVELLQVGADEVLIGEVPSGDDDPSEFSLLGQLVETSEETDWGSLERGGLGGKRVKVQGSWKGPRKFRADKIAPRGPGRDRIAGRIDAMRRVEGGWEASVMIFTVVLKDATPVEHEHPVADYARAPERKTRQPSTDIERDEDDVFGKGIAITDTLRLMGQIEGKATSEQDYDLNGAQERDRADFELPVRLRLTWSPSDKLRGQAEVRYTSRLRHEETPQGVVERTTGKGVLGETWLQWRDIGTEGFDFTVGRQDFDDPREWVFDENLDALRATWIRPTWRLDLATATRLSQGSPRDEASGNLIAYLSNNDPDRHLAVWSVYRDIEAYDVTSSHFPAEQSWHFGARALGEWLPDSEVWAEFAYELGNRPLYDSSGVPTGGEADVSAWAYDAGITWFPAFAEPLWLTLGYALGRGHGDDGTFRQTGFQDNTDRFGGVTSFQYYGELFDPELSNLGILTLGIGTLVAERTSLDLVVHTYTQDQARAEYSPLPERAANLKARPSGIDAHLGWEADLILGYRRYKSWDLELVAATFDPGAGIDREDRAWLLKAQLRYRF